MNRAAGRPLILCDNIFKLYGINERLVMLCHAMRLEAMDIDNYMPFR